MCPYHIIVRPAAFPDLPFVEQDGYLSNDILQQKIEAGEVFILLVDDQPCGYLRLEFLWSIVPYIALIWIQENRRKKGFSRDLLEFVENHLVSKGHNTLYSSSQADEPLPQAWHRHMGFEECGMINGINEGGIGEIFFRKHLTADVDAS